MRRYSHLLFVVVLTLLGACCSHKTLAPNLKPTAFGAAVVESSGGKQFAQTGALLPQPVIVQVNDDQGTAVPGALVEFVAAPGVSCDPVSALTDSSGQVTTTVSLGGMAGRYEIIASTLNKSQKRVDLRVQEIALGYQQTLGRQVNDQYCDRCHNPESTVERVSNFDNLDIKPHPFTEGDAMNKLTDAEITSIVTYGGPALNRSALMPAWGHTISKSDMQALISYIRAVSDPPSRSAAASFSKR